MQSRGELQSRGEAYLLSRNSVNFVIDLAHLADFPRLALCTKAQQVQQPNPGDNSNPDADPKQQEMKKFHSTSWKLPAGN